MTTSISSLISIPYNVFASPAASILLPITLGTATGLSCGREHARIAYRAMKQPPLSPPAKVFGPAWVVLYGLMGYAAHRAVTMSPPSLDLTGQMAALYSVQLGLNLLWMPIFFGMRRLDLALADMVPLVGINGYLTYLYFSIDSLAGWCQVPYVAWLVFATYLTGGVGYLNKSNISEATLSKRS
ncbi:TspO/MBR-related protein [Annulohypoxylon bovei var. microspora]|nr:TspO/MBR-related protein [Annulohypoxylon bovei var. microspora]